MKQSSHFFYIIIAVFKNGVLVPESGTVLILFQTYEIFNRITCTF